MEIMALSRGERAPDLDIAGAASSGELLPSDEQLQSLIGSSLSDDSGLRALKGFKLDLSANPGFRKFFFAARCKCGTAGLLSVEVAREKTLAQVEKALPELVRRLESQAKSFYAMSCDVHQRMLGGPSSRPDTQ